MANQWYEKTELKDFESWIHDVAPHLAGASWNDPDLQAYWRGFKSKSAAQVATSRADGAKKAVKTKAKNAAKGISQKNIAGSAKQKQWAAQIRGDACAKMGEEFREWFDGRDTHATFWIENRNGDWSLVFAQCKKRFQDYLDAEAAVVAAKQAGGPVSGAEYKRTEAIRAHYRGLGL